MTPLGTVEKGNGHRSETFLKGYFEPDATSCKNAKQCESCETDKDSETDTICILKYTVQLSFVSKPPRPVSHDNHRIYLL
jgi:hypothetical protein